VSAPYGDGKAFVSKYGVNAVNRDGISIELSGYDLTPVDAFAWGEYVALIAYWVDYMEIPYDSLPLNPYTDINAFIWHEEFMRGTGKKCPLTWLRDHTDDLYHDVAAYLKPFQTDEVGSEQPKPDVPEVPKPLFATPLPIAELIQFADRDRDVVTALATREVDQFIYVADRVEAIQDTPRPQYPAMSAPHVGPVLKKGEPFDVTWMVKAGDGNWYYVTDWWTRIRVDHTRRIQDASEAA
jgi:hypothetical protein